MSDHLDYNNKVGILDPEGLNPNPLNNEPYSQTYKDLAKVWSKLPGYTYAKTILESISDYPLTIAIMGTGTGKTVLVPKFALHYTGYGGKVGVTLPKKIITLSTAEFSARISDVVLGVSIGYVYKGSNKSMYGPQNKIVYMTDGTLIMQILKDPLLTEYKVIIVDEAHERKVQIDLILLFLKNLLVSGKRPDLRVILMSATIDGARYLEYFSGVKGNIIEVAGHPNHKIDVRFLEKPTMDYLTTGLEIIRPMLSAPTKKDILFFITTGKEALDTCRLIRPAYPKVYCIEVYADMDEKLKLYAQERDKFMELGNYDQKLVIATNVAESSLTIDGLKYVVDSCYELYSYFDPDSNAQILESRLISKDRALQRRGRVGRTEPGTCYHLLTKSQFDALKPYSEPDILKQDITIDTIKIISITENKFYNDGYEIISQMMDTPKQAYVNYTYDLLKLYRILDNHDHLETKLASDILLFSSMPLNQSLFLIFSYQLFCAREASIILGMLEVLKNRVTDLFYKEDTICDSDCKKSSSKTYLKKIANKKSDHLTLLKIFEDYKVSSDRIAWAKKWGVILSKLKRAEKNFNTYYRKIINSAKAPQIGGAKKVDLNKRLIEALKRSHKHLMASNLEPTYAKKKNQGQIQQASVVNFNYSRKELSNKKFIFNEFASINGKWEFSMVTLII
jgi:HrpA-like RNA helicase